MAIQELFWLRHLVSGITTSTLKLRTLYNNKQASLSMFTNRVYQLHSHHVGIHVCQIREIIEDGKDVVIDYCNIERRIVDGPTKPLVGVEHVVFVKMYGLS